MVEVEGGRFKCVPERLESKFILSLSGEIWWMLMKIIVKRCSN